MNANETIAHVAGIMNIADVESTYVCEENSEYPRKGVLQACLQRIGELHMKEGQSLAAPKVTQKQEVTTDFLKFLELINFKNDIPGELLKCTHFTSKKNEAGDLFYTVQVEKWYYLKFRDGCKRYLGDILKAAQKRGMWARLVRNQVGEAHLQVNWGKQYQR